MDDLKAVRSGSNAKGFINKFNKKFELRTVLNSPGKMHFFGLKVEQAEEYSIRSDGDDKLKIIDEKKDLENEQKGVSFFTQCILEVPFCLD